MKIEFTERDTDIINAIDEDLRNSSDPVLLVDELNKDYWIRFKVTDIAKANNFINQLYLNKIENIDTKDDLGIDVRSIDFSHDVDRIIGRLENLLNELKGKQL